jgi:hypothetical protein
MACLLSSSNLNRSSTSPKSCVIAKTQQVFFPLRAASTLGHTGTNKGDDKATLTGALELLKASQVSWELLSIQYAGFFFLIEALGFLIVEVAIAKIEGPAVFRKGYLHVSTFANDLNIFTSFIVNNLIKSTVFTDSSELFDGGIGIKGWLGEARHT